MIDIKHKCHFLLCKRKYPMSMIILKFVGNQVHENWDSEQSAINLVISMKFAYLMPEAIFISYFKRLRRL